MNEAQSVADWINGDEKMKRKKTHQYIRRVISTHQKLNSLKNELRNE